MVTVINPPEDPVPVTGEVEVINPPEDPIPVVIQSGINGAAIQPVQATVTRELPASTSSKTVDNFNIFTVPTGKMLKIEYVSGYLDTNNVTSAVALLLGIQTVINGAPITHYVGPFPNPSQSTGRRMLGQLVTLYADADSVVAGFLDRGSSSVTTSVKISISGQLVDTP